MYALYTAVALIGLVTFWLPLALLRRFTRGVPLNVRARLGGAAPIGAGNRIYCCVTRRVGSGFWRWATGGAS